MRRKTGALTCKKRVCEVTPLPAKVRAPSVQPEVSLPDKSAVSKPAPIPDRPHGVRPAITALPMSKIGEVSAPDFGDPDIVPLWFGEGDLPTPAFICDAAAAAMRRGETFYTFKRGIPELREAIATYLSGLHARPVAAENVVV